MSTRRSDLPLALLVAAALLAAGSARAEVAVALAQIDDDDSSPISSYIMRITDDSSPLGMWAPVTAPSTTRVVLNATGGVTGDGPPSLVHDAATGLIAVAWSRDTGGGRDIVLSRFDGTAWTEPAVVSAGPDDEIEPKLAVDAAAGLVHVVYQVDGIVPRVEHRQAPLDLSAWSAPTVVSAAGDTALRPAIALVDGLVRVVYENHPLGIGITPREIVVAESLAGAPFSCEVVATTYHAEPNAPRLHTAPGRWWVDWVDADGEMAFVTLDGSGVWSQPSIEPFSGLEDRDFGARERIRARVLAGP